MQPDQALRSTVPAPTGRPSSLFAAQLVLVALGVDEGGLRVLATAQEGASTGSLPRSWLEQDDDLDIAGRARLAELLPGGCVASAGLPPVVDRASESSTPALVTAAQVILVAHGPLQSRLELFTDPGLLGPRDRELLHTAVRAAADLLADGDLAAKMLPSTFTLRELRAVYEVFWQQEIDASNFSKRVLAAEGFLQPLGRIPRARGGRPPEAYRRGDGPAPRITSPR